MGSVNIRRDVADPFYRYKMERLQAKIEGKGNGIKTVIVNLSNVADQLARPGNYVIKYFGFELGAQTNIDPKDDRWIINGAHDASKLQDYLDGFINKFVLCKECKNPETVINLKDGKILMDCKACGKISTADPTQKLTAFILKSAPKKGKKDKSTKKADRKARKEAERNGTAEDNDANGDGNSPGGSGSDHDADDNGNDETNGNNSDDELTRKINAEAKELNEPEVKEKDIQWSVDMSEEAIKARAKALPDDLKASLVLEDGDDEEKEGSNYDVLGKWIEEKAEAEGHVSKVKDIDIFIKAKELGIESKHKTCTVLAQCIFDDDIVKQIPARAAMLKKMITSERHEKSFLGGLERFIGLDKPNLIPVVSAILLSAYNADVLSEEVLTAWGNKASKKYVDLATSRKVRKSAEKFLEWLANAESDDEDDSDEEDDE
jgi:translation initiation factor 5